MPPPLPGRLHLIPIRTPRQDKPFPLLPTILAAIATHGETLQHGDLLAISSKFAALSQRRYRALPRIQPSRQAQRLAHRHRLDPRLAHLILHEAEAIYGGVPGFVLTVKDGVLAPNAGIDKSNIFPDHVILHPRNPFRLAHQLHQTLLAEHQLHIGILLTDSRLMPSRLGTTGVTVACAGFEPIRDERGRPDLFGKPLRVTRRNLADDLSAAVQLLMGEADEQIPVVIIRVVSGPAPWTLITRRIRRAEIAIDYPRDLYISSLRGTRPPLYPAPSARRRA